MNYYLFSKTHFLELVKEEKSIKRLGYTFENHECMNFINRKMITFPIEGLPITNYKEYLKKYKDSECVQESLTLEKTTYGEPYYFYSGELIQVQQ